MRHDLNQLTFLLKENNFQPTNFIEIGSRDGHDTNYVCNFWGLSNKHCYIIEAHPQCYSYIINQYPHFNTFNIAASDKTEVVEFNAGVLGEEKNVGVSSLLNRTLDSFISEKIEIDAWRMEEIMVHLNVDYFDLIKIDVEGMALQVLKGFGEKITNIKAIQVELELKQVWEGQSYYQDVVDYLTQFGFRILNEVTLDEYQKDVLFIK